MDLVGMRTARIALLALAATWALDPAAAQERSGPSTHGAWSIYPMDEAARGCRMARPAGQDAFLIVHANAHGGFALGMVSRRWRLRPGSRWPGRIDLGGSGEGPVAAEGVAENGRLLMFDDPADDPEALAADFVAAERIGLETEAGGGTALDLVLEDGQGALDALMACVARDVEPPDGATPQGADISMLHAGADYMNLRPAVLAAGWELVPQEPQNDLDANWQRAFDAPELGACTMTGLGYCSFRYRSADGRILGVVTVGGDEFTVRDWSVRPGVPD